MRGWPCRRAVNEGWVVSAAGYYNTQRLFPVGQFGVGEGVVYFGMQAGLLGSVWQSISQFSAMDEKSGKPILQSLFKSPVRR